MKSLRRFLDISHIIIPPLFFFFITKRKPTSKKHLASLLKVRLAFQKLGPTYIKFGQMLSARPDIVGFSLANELRNLLDHEEAIPFEKIKKELEEELKEPYTKVFKHIDETPLATASIGQVHRATLKNGHVVAIKVRRPGIEQVIQGDLPVLKQISKTMDILIPLKGLHFTYIYQQFSEWITNELNFQIEGRRADKFKDNMEPVTGIHIPKIYWEHTTEKLLVMEYLEGHTLNELLDMMHEQKIETLYDLKINFPINPDTLIERMIASLAKQTFVDRFFHGDLHPANIIVQKNNVIAFVDFGIVGSLNEEEYTQILLCMLSLVESDPETMVKVITSLISDPLTPQEIGELHQEFSDEIHKLHEDIGGKVTINHVLTLLFPLAEKYHVMWSSGFLLAAKTVGQIDSVSSLIGIRKPLVELMKPEVEKSLATSMSSDFSQEKMYKGMLDLIQAGKKLPQTLTEIENLIHTSDLTKLGQTVVSAQKHTLRNAFVASFAFVAVVPFLSQLHINQQLQQILYIGLPLLFIVILVKIFTTRK